MKNANCLIAMLYRST